MSQHALGWLKVCYDVDKQECQKWTDNLLFLPYVAIGWRLVTSGWGNAGVGIIRGFLLSLGVVICHSLLYFSTRSRLWFGWPAGRKTAASITRGPRQTPGY